MAQPHNAQFALNREGEEYITFKPYPGRVKGLVADKVVVDSENAMLLREGRLEPVLYFPREDVRMDLLNKTAHTTYCPYRGVPTYFDLDVDGRHLPNVAWSYESPYEDAEFVRDYVAFYRDRLDRWQESSGTPPARDVSVEHANPLIDWLILEAWQSVSMPDLVTRWVEALNGIGLGLLRFALITRTLHPLLSGAAYRWNRGVDDITEVSIKHEMLSSAQYLDSPLVPIFDGAGGVRRRLDRGGDRDDYPILADLRAEGGTDYVAMPLVFSDGQINAVTFATDRPGGFDIRQLGLVNEVLPLFSRLVEVFLQREKSVTLLETYLGRQTGRRVLEGKVRRGDGEDIHAVIWFTDLRQSSTLAATMSRAAFLERLNCFFDCMAGAVLDNEGEVLRFIGDAALAIFPMGPDEAAGASACGRALAAAEQARRSVEAFNVAAREAGEPLMDYGIGLHIGDVTYGNIGTASRLEFTVIGAAANEAARIESLSKTLGRAVLLSEDFVAHCPGRFRSLGTHHLRGTERSAEIFTPEEDDGAAGAG